jgi:PDGLE domain-containing protein
VSRIELRSFVGLALGVAVALALFASSWASSSPDGLEQVAETNGFLEDGRLHLLQERSPVPEYAFPGVDDPRLATALAGLVGTLLVALVGFGLIALARRRAEAS